MATHASSQTIRFLAVLALCATAGNAVWAGEASAPKPPWPPAYKIKPDQKERLTEADVVGPDGIVYPNWTKTGVQGGIPRLEVSGKAEDYGARPDDGVDDGPSLQKAVDELGAKGGGVLLLSAGVYHLDRPMAIRSNKVVLRGEGADKTRIVFRYAIPASGAVFYWPPEGHKAGNGTTVELHCLPKNLVKMTIHAGEKEIARWEASKYSANTFSLKKVLRDAGIAKGPCELKGVGEYKDGSKREAVMHIDFDPERKNPVFVPDSASAIRFAGKGLAGPRIKLAKDGARGARELELEDASTFKSGDRVLIDGPPTDRWKKLTRNVCLWGTYRQYMAEVERVEGNRVRLSQPLRIEFPVVDGSWVQKDVVIERSGIEDLCIEDLCSEQTENLWLTAVMFSHAWNCWARGVKVKKCGRLPVYGDWAKWCEIRDCVFDDAHFKGGGAAYAGWDKCYDCLIENLETFKFRHAPLFQWSASGKVIRQSVFHESDGQWHSGWTNENLMELCMIDSKTGHGGTGYGLWASPPEDTEHGPNGPRNVVYNCDVRSPKSGLWMGGMNENWLILYNRFEVGGGPGIYARTFSFDHVIRGNHFLLKDKTSPLIQLASADCSGVELLANKLYGGGGKLLVGPARLLVEQDNEVLPASNVPRPAPAVASIYEWQLTNVKP